MTVLKNTNVVHIEGVVIITFDAVCNCNSYIILVNV